MAPTYEPFWRNEKLDSSDARASETLLLASELLSKSWMWRTFMLVGYLGYREGWQVDKLESRTLRPSHAITTDSRGWLAHHERNPFSLATAHFLSLGPLAHCKRVFTILQPYVYNGSVLVLVHAAPLITVARLATTKCKAIQHSYSANGKH